ncbi:hypothetical protein [Roseobacter sp.]|uniref:hypothetical protein n=1 Tax=Roseobacter sp. TaxID=1907202 RepID=UPI002965D88C|nr:hypothetical protein [Roseobacter sp.]MDW3182652.1 hypothetical protein [Roseobacter sp.]
MSQTLNQFRPPLVPKTLTTDILFARGFYFPATKEDIKAMKSELAELQRYYSEYRPLQVMPYDDQRFEQLFDIIGKRVKRLEKSFS